MLLLEHARAQLAWAEHHKDWTAEDWRKVRWSDECSIERGKGQRQEYVFRRIGEALERWAVQGRPHFIKVTKMFWAAFDHGIRTDLVAMEGDSESPKGGVTAHLPIPTVFLMMAF